jgi:hypothetical protein
MNQMYYLSLTLLFAFGIIAVALYSGSQLASEVTNDPVTIEAVTNTKVLTAIEEIPFASESADTDMDNEWDGREEDESQEERYRYIE